MIADDFLLHSDAVWFARERLGFHSDAAQQRVLLARANRGILNCTRQWGKSTVTAVMAVHRAVSEQGSLVLVLSPSERQSSEFVRKCAGFVRKLGMRVRGDGDNDVSIQLPNGSRIVGLPGAERTIRGFSAVSLMLIDEAARVDDELYFGVTPMLAVGGGDLWLLSTPYGKRGFFYDTWAKGGAEWLRISVPVTECPRIPKSFVEEQRRVQGDRRFRHYSESVVIPSQCLSLW